MGNSLEEGRKKLRAAKQNTAYAPAEQKKVGNALEEGRKKLRSIKTAERETTPSLVSTRDDNMRASALDMLMNSQRQNNLENRLISGGLKVGDYSPLTEEQQKQNRDALIAGKMAERSTALTALKNSRDPQKQTILQQAKNLPAGEGGAIINNTKQYVEGDIRGKHTDANGNVSYSIPVKDVAVSPYEKQKADEIRARANARMIAEETVKARESAKNNPLLGEVQNVATRFAGSIMTPLGVITGHTDPNDPMYAKEREAQAYNQGVKTGVKNKLGIEDGTFASGAVDFGVDTLTSMIETGLRAAVGGGIGSVVGGAAGATAETARKIASAVGSTQASLSAFSSGYVSAKDKGVDNGTAIMNATAQGIAEWFFERFSIERLLADTPIYSFKDAFKEIGKNMATEGSEEFFTDISNAITDRIIMGKNSDFSMAKVAYLKEGMTDEEATKQAALDVLKQAALSFLGGAISGGVLGTGKSVGRAFFADRAANNSTMTAEQMRETADAIDPSTLIMENGQVDTEAAQKLEAERTFLNEAAQKLESGKALTNAEKARAELGVTDVVSNSKAVAADSIEDRAEQFPAKAADVYKKNYDNSYIVSYDRNMREAYLLGAKGESLESLEGNEDFEKFFGGHSEAVTEMWQAGIEDYTERAKAENILSSKNYVYTERQKNGLSFIGKTTGYKFNAQVNLDPNVNAKVDLGTKTITFNPNSEQAGDDILHEFGHITKSVAEVEFKEVQNSIVGFLARQKGYSDSTTFLDDAIADYRNKYEKQLGRKLTDDEVIEEIVCDAMPAIFSDEKELKKLAKENRTFVQKVLDFLNEMIEALTSFNVTGESNRVSREIKAHATVEELTDMRRKALNALNAVKENTTTENTEQQAGEKFSINEDFSNELDNWNRSERKLYKNFNLGSTGSVLQGMGAVESDLMLSSDTIHHILEHDEMNLGLIKQIPNVLEYPTLILKSKTSDSSLVIFGSIRDENGNAIAVVLDLMYSDKNIVIDDMQILTSAYAKTTNPENFVRSSEVLYANKKRVNRLFNRMGFRAPISVSHDGSIGKISYSGGKVNISGMKFDDVFTEKAASEIIEGRKFEKLSLKRFNEKNEDIRYSLNVDSSGRKLTEAQQEYFKDSKVRDENGNLLVLYHGTPSGNFTVFRDWSYLSPNKEYAARYMNPSASSIRFGKKVDNPKVYEVYANAEKIFDTRKSEDRDVYMSEFYRKYGNGTPLMESGLPDWTDGEDLIEFFEDNGYDYDGIILDEGADGGYGSDVLRRGFSYMVKGSSHIKNVDNTNPTKNEDIRFSLKTPVEETDRLIALHNMNEEALESALDLGGLAMPSFAVMRSGKVQNGYGDISVVASKDSIDPKKGSNIYGGDAWTPVFPQVDAKVSSDALKSIQKRLDDIFRDTSWYKKDNNLRISLDEYNVETDLDRYRTFRNAYKNNDLLKIAYLKDKGREIPTQEIAKEYSVGNVKVDDAYLKELAGQIDGFTAFNDDNQVERYGEIIKKAKLNLFKRKYGDELAGKIFDNSKPISFSEVNNALYTLRKYANGQSKGGETQLDYKAIYDELDKAFDDETKKDFELWLDELGKDVVEKLGVRNDKDLFTPTGNRRNFESLHYDYNLANVIRVMKTQSKQGRIQAFSGPGSAKGAMLERYKSIEDVRKDLGRLGFTEESAKEAYDSFHEHMKEVSGMISDDLFDGSNAIAEGFSKTKTRAGIESYLRREWLGWGKVTEDNISDIVDEMMDLKEEANKLPMEYFEAKLYRAYPLNEALAVVAPDTTSEKLIKRLQDEGVNVITYKDGDSADRIEKLNSVENSKFSLKVDRDYMKAVEYGDTETVKYQNSSKVVDNFEKKIENDIKSIYVNEPREKINEAVSGIQGVIRTASDGVRSIRSVQSSGIRTIAEGITDEFVKKGFVDFRGRQLSEDNAAAAGEIATFAMILRNPKFETERVFYTKGNTIVGSNAVTSYLMDGSVISKKPLIKELIYDETDRMRRLGADGYFVLHNHPSGDPKASDPDVRVSEIYRDHIKGFRGHIVIDHNSYTYIDENAKRYLNGDIQYVNGESNDYSVNKTNNPYINKYFTDIESVAGLAKELVHGNEFSVVAFMDAKGKLRALQELHNNFVRSKDFQNYISNTKLKYGSAHAFLLTDSNEVFYSSFIENTYFKHLLTDVLSVAGDDYISSNYQASPEYDSRGRKDRFAYGVSEGKNKYAIDNGNEYSWHQKFSLNVDDYIEKGTAAYAEAIKKLVEKYGAIEKGENPRVDVDVPKKSHGRNVRRFARTTLESGILDDEESTEVKKKIVNGGLTYVEISDKTANEYADNEIKNKGYDGAQEEWNAFVEAKENLGKNEIAVGEKLLKHYAEEGDTESLMKMICELSVEGTRAGQTVQAFRLLKKMVDDPSPAGAAAGLYYIRKTVDRMNSDLAKKFAGKKKIPQLVLKQELVDEYTAAENREAVSAKIFQDLADQYPATLSEKVRNYRYLSMLLNPPTHLRNILSNMAFVPAVIKKDMISYAIESASARKNPNIVRTKAIKVSKKYADFARKDTAEMAGTLKGEGKEISDEILKRRTIFKTKALEKLRRFNFDALGTEDLWFKNFYYKRSLAMYLEANKVDLTNEKEINKARQIALNEAFKNTYNDANKLADAIANLEKSSKGVELFVEGLVPFKRTPINIVKRGLEYSPAGLVNSLVRGTAKLNSGDITVSEWADGIGAGLTGTVTLGLGMLLAAMGIVRGAYDDDDEDMDKYLKRKEYSVIIGNKSYTIDWLAPAALPLFVGVELLNLFRGDNEMTMNGLVSSAMSIAEPMLNLTMLSGLNSAISAVSFADDSEKLVTLGGETMFNYLGQFVPSVLGRTANVVDPTRRYIYTDKNKDLWGPFAYFIGKMQNKIPFLSYTLNPYLDEWGEDETESRMLRAFEAYLSPGYLTTERGDRLSNEIVRVYESNISDEDKKKVVPKKQDKYFNITRDGVNVKKDLTADEYTFFQKTAGNAAYNILNEIIESKAYEKLSADQQALTIADVYTIAKEIGRTAVMEKYGKDNESYSINTKWIRNAIEADANGEMSVAETILLKHATANDTAASELTDATYEKYLKLGMDAERLVEYMAGKTPQLTDVPSEGYTSYTALKKAMGSAFANEDWHHIVEQESGYSSDLVNNKNNIVSLPTGTNSVHKLVTYTEDERKKLRGMSFEQQWQYGVDKLRQYGTLVPAKNGWCFIPDAERIAEAKGLEVGEENPWSYQQIGEKINSSTVSTIAEANDAIKEWADFEKKAKQTDDKSAKKNLRTKLTKQFKEQYIGGDSKERNRIINLLTRLRYNGEAIYTDKDILEWAK